MKPQYIGIWHINDMEMWDMEYINLVGPGHVRIDRDGNGFMQFGAVEAGLDCRVEKVGNIERLEFTFQGSDEGDPVSGRGWATVSGSEMTGRIHFYQGDESGFTATKEAQGKASGRPTPKVIRLPKRLDTARAHTFPEKRTAHKIRYGQPVEVCFSDAEKELLEEHTLIDREYMDRLHSTGPGEAWAGRYTLGELEDIVGYIAEGESHVEDKKAKRKLQSLISRLNGELDSYDDGG